MNREYWTKELQEAERELDAAKGRTALNVGARKLQRARAELKRLEAEQPWKGVRYNRDGLRML